MSTAIKALNEAETVIAKQTDTILQTSYENSLCLREKRSSENVSKSLPTSTPKDKTAKFSPIMKMKNIDTIANKSSNPEPSSYSSTVKAVSTEESRNVSPDRLNVSHDVLSEAKAHRQRKRRRASNITTGRKPGIILGSCFRKMDVFLSRMGPDVNAAQVQDFCKGLLNDCCEVEMLKSKFPALYSSFRITCYSRDRDKILDPDNWETGAIVRPFYRKAI